MPMNILAINRINTFKDMSGFKFEQLSNFIHQLFLQKPNCKTNKTHDCNTDRNPDWRKYPPPRPRNITSQFEYDEYDGQKTSKTNTTRRRGCS